jgi:hypothetical protein
MCAISCANARESIEEGVLSPNPQTMRDRMLLDGSWDAEFEEIAYSLAKYAIARDKRLSWRISVDETHDAFFGNMSEIEKEPARFASRYKNDVKGATGSFEFLVVSISSSRYKIPLGVLPVQVGISSELWLEQQLRRALLLMPKAPVLADRGFCNVWFLQMLERIGCFYVLRMSVKNKQVMKKIQDGQKKISYFMKEAKSNDAFLVELIVVTEGEFEYYFMSNIDVKPKQVLYLYRHRWDIENIFKLSDRALLKTSSSNYRMRLFCLLFSFILYLAWQFNRTAKQSFRGFLKTLILEISRVIGKWLDVIGRLLPS